MGTCMTRTVRVSECFNMYMAFSAVKITEINLLLMKHRRSKELFWQVGLFPKVYN